MNPEAVLCLDCEAGNCSSCDDTRCVCPHVPSTDPWRAWAGLGDAYV